MHWTRRECFRMAGAAMAAPGAARVAFGAQVVSKSEQTKLSIPGLYRGKVVAVESPNSIVSGRYQAQSVRAMMRKGMAELSGGDWVDTWRQLFEPGDVVGIKVNPVGQPHVISDATVVGEIIEGLKAAGVKLNDIVVYDRYR